MSHYHKDLCKIWRKLISCFKNEKNLVNFDPSTRKSQKFALSLVPVGSYCNYLMFDQKKYRGVTFHDTEEWCKILKKTDLWFGKWHEEYDKFSPEHLKVSKLGLSWDPFIQSRKNISLKFTEEQRAMTMKNDAKFEEDLTCRFKIDIRNLLILTRAFESPQNYHFDALLLSKVYIVWAKKVQSSYLSWHWRVIQNLVRNQLLVSELTWGIWQILTWALKSLKNFNFNGLLLNKKVYIVWAKKVQRSYLSKYWSVM